MSDIAKFVQEALEQGTASLVSQFPTFGKSLNYVLLQDGKRLRGQFCGQVGFELGLGFTQLESLIFAVEAVHNGTLVQDDLPLLDDDRVRRGKPACHVAFGEAEAMLLGDILLGPCLLAVLGDSSMPAEARVHISEQFLVTIGRISEGQVLEKRLESSREISEGELLSVCALKTASLFELAFSAPCLLLKKPNQERYLALKRFGFLFGMLFQLADDVADSKNRGETANIACLLEQGRVFQLADEYYEEAEDLLAKLEGFSFLEEQLVKVRDSIFAG